MSRKQYTADFETTTDNWYKGKPLNARVWVYGIMDINDDNEELKWGTSIDDFMLHCEKNKGDYYFHNLKFDGNFILSWLLKNNFKFDRKRKSRTFNTVISKDRAWYKIEIVYKRHKDRHLDKVVIYDSLKKLPFSVSKIGKDFDVGVEKIKWSQEDYTKKRPVGYIPNELEIEYLEHDLKVMRRALNKQFETNLTRMTVASDAMNDFKKHLGKKKFDYHFPSLPISVDTDIRQSYFGGFTWVNPKVQNKDVGEGIVFDVRSLYPSVMYTRWLPIGDPVFFRGKYEKDKSYPLYVQKFSCSFELKEGKIPTIQGGKVRNSTMAEYMTSSNGEEVTLCLTSIDLKLFLDHYNITSSIEWISGYKFQATRGLFKNYIDKWIYMKETYKGAVRQLAKLMLNSLYGKFGTNPDITQKVPYLDENGVVKLMDDELTIGKTSYVPMATFITAYARELTIRTATLVYDRICYCDTDSIHLEGTSIPDEIKHMVDMNDGKTKYPENNKHGLGYWVHESTFVRAKFIRPKRYIEQLVPKTKYVSFKGKTLKHKKRPKLNIQYDFRYFNGNLNIKCAGIQYKITKKMNYNDFNIGFKTEERLVPISVNGGVALVNGVFELKS